MTTLDKMLQGLANALGASLSTLTTTAKTVVGAINELKSGLTSTNTTVSGHTSTIGSGSLNTTSQTLIGAVNELNGKIFTSIFRTSQVTGITSTDTDKTLFTPTVSGVCFLIIRYNYTYVSLNYKSGFVEYTDLPTPDGSCLMRIGTVTAGVPVLYTFRSLNSQYSTADVTYIIF